MVNKKICICLKVYEYCIFDIVVEKIVEIVICIGVIVVGLVLFLIECSFYIIICVIYKYKDFCE